jgi:hypothetical protein
MAWPLIEPCRSTTLHLLSESATAEPFFFNQIFASWIELEVFTHWTENVMLYTPAFAKVTLLFDTTETPLLSGSVLL